MYTYIYTYMYHKGRTGIGMLRPPMFMVPPPWKLPFPPSTPTGWPPCPPWRACIPSSAGLMKHTMQCALLFFHKQFISTEK